MAPGWLVLHGLLWSRRPRLGSCIAVQVCLEVDWKVVEALHGEGALPSAFRGREIRSLQFVQSRGADK